MATQVTTACVLDSVFSCKLETRCHGQPARPPPDGPALTHSHHAHARISTAHGLLPRISIMDKTLRDLWEACVRIDTLNREGVGSRAPEFLKSHEKRLELLEKWDKEVSEIWAPRVGEARWCVWNHDPTRVTVLSINKTNDHTELEVICTDNKNEGSRTVWDCETWPDRLPCARAARWSYDAQPQPEDCDLWDRHTEAWERLCCFPGSGFADSDFDVQWHIDVTPSDVATAEHDLVVSDASSDTDGSGMSMWCIFTDTLPRHDEMSMFLFEKLSTWGYSFVLRDVVLMLIQRSWPQNVVYTKDGTEWIGEKITIQQIMVRPDVRRQGHAKAAIKDTIKLARESGCAGVVIQSILGKDMRALATSLQFEPIMTQPDCVFISTK